MPYTQLPGFEHVYLEDSYVLDLQINRSSVEFSLLVVLLEQHRLYKPPTPDEQYCYRSGWLRFPNVERTEWLEKSVKPYTDATGTVDYGNIDEFFAVDRHYYIRGDWGELEIVSSPPMLQIENT